MGIIKELGKDPEVLLREGYTAAYNALPESYRNDHALTFFVDVNGNLCAEHDLHNEEYIFTGELWVR